MIYDTLIIGAGPAGISAAINLKQKRHKVAIIEFSMPGGKVNICPRIDNFPGYHQISGPDLAMEFFLKMNEANIEFISSKVNGIVKEDNSFKLITTSGEFFAKTVIVASGTDEKKLNLPNEKEVFGHGLSYCAICDGHFFKDKIVSIIAEDKYAISEAVYLASLASKVYIITSKNELPKHPLMSKELESFSNIEYIYNHKVIALEGNPLSSIILDDGSSIKMDGIFPLLGYIPNTSFISYKEILDEDGFIKVNKEFETDIKGLFAIGDCISRELKQIYLAVTDASRCIEAVERYL